MSGVLLDTNVVSELVAPRPKAALRAWIDALDEERVFLSVVSIAEIRRGAERLTAGRRKAQLLEWVGETLPERFGDRLLPVDGAIAQNWGILVARRQAAGRPIASMDAFIAATAAARDLSLATRDVAAFAGLDLDLVNPWTA